MRNYVSFLSTPIEVNEIFEDSIARLDVYSIKQYTVLPDCPEILSGWRGPGLSELFSHQRISHRGSRNDITNCDFHGDGLDPLSPFSGSVHGMYNYQMTEACRSVLNMLQ